MKNLFQYAEYLQGKAHVRGKTYNHIELLKKAVKEILDGFSSLEEASEYDLTFYNAFGVEISPECTQDAVNFCRQNSIDFRAK